MKDNLLQEAISCLSIIDIRLCSSNIEVSEEYSPYLKTEKNGNQKLEIQFTNSIDSHKVGLADTEESETSIVEFFYNTAFRIRDEIDKDETSTAKPAPIIEVNATFRAVYRILPDKEINDEILSQFGFHNVGFNVWPYWREFASSTAMRIGVPNVTVPFYNIVNNQKK